MLGRKVAGTGDWTRPFFQKKAGVGFIFSAFFDFAVKRGFRWVSQAFSWALQPTRPPSSACHLSFQSLRGIVFSVHLVRCCTMSEFSGQKVKLAASDAANAPTEVPLEIANMSVTIHNMLEGSPAFLSRFLCLSRCHLSSWSFHAPALFFLVSFVLVIARVGPNLLLRRQSSFSFLFPLIRLYVSFRLFSS